GAGLKQLFLAPDGSGVAYARQLTAPVSRTEATLSFAVSNATHALEAVSINGGSLLTPGQQTTDILPESIRWSPDGREIAFLSYGAARRDPVRLVRLRIGERAMQSIDLGELDPVPIAEMQRAELEWTQNGDLIVLTAMTVDDRKASATARRDWWLIAR